MADLDQISHAIGRIEANTNNLAERLDQTEVRNQARFDALSMQLANLSPTVIRVDKIESRVALIEPVVEHVRRVRWLTAIAATVIIALAGVAGSVGSFAKEWFFN